MFPSHQITQADLARVFLQQQQQQQKDALANAQTMSSFVSKAQKPQSFADTPLAYDTYKDLSGDRKNPSNLIPDMESRIASKRMIPGQDNPFTGVFGVRNTTAETVLKDDRKDPGKDETKKQFEMISELADQSAAIGDYTQAIGFYNKILEINPNAVSVWTSLGHCYSMVNDNLSALKAYQKAMSISEGGEKDEQLWYGIGLLYEKIEDYQNAELAFKNGANICTSSAVKGELCYHLGYILKAKTEYDEAIKMLSTAILVGGFATSRSVEILCTIGRCFEEKSNLLEALKMYKHALSLDESNPFTHEFIGWLYFQMDNPTEALDYLQKECFQENDEDGELHYMIARCYMRLKDYNTAYELFQRSLSKHPYVSFYWGSFGIMLCEINQLKLAYEAFNQALRLNPNIPENYYNLGCLFELLRQPQEAISFYDRALAMQPSLTIAQEGKIRMLFNQGKAQMQ